MALVLPNQFVETAYLSKLSIKIEGSRMTGTYSPPNIGGNHTNAGLLTQGVSNLSGIVTREDERYHVIRGRWKHVEGVLTEGDFEMVLDSIGNDGRGWWMQDGDPIKNDWTWSVDVPAGRDPIGSRMISRMGSRMMSRVGSMNLGQGITSPLSGVGGPSDSRVMTRDPTIRNFERIGSVMISRQVSVSSRQASVASRQASTVDAKPVVKEEPTTMCCYYPRKFVTSIWLVRWSLLCADLFLIFTAIQLASTIQEKEMVSDMGLKFNVLYAFLTASFCAAYASMPIPANIWYVLGIVGYASAWSVYLSSIAFLAQSLVLYILVISCLGVGLLVFMAYVAKREPTNAVYVSGVTLYAIGYICFFLIALEVPATMYILGSALFTTGSLALVVATWPKGVSQAIPYQQSGSLFWGCMMFLLGSILFAVDSINSGMGNTLSISHDVILAGYTLFTMGRLYFVAASTTAECNFFFLSAVPGPNKIRTRKHSASLDAEGDIVSYNSEDIVRSLEASYDAPL